MALFGFGKSTNPTPTPPGGDAAPAKAAPGEWSPAKAQKFFDHAKVVHESQNFEYAMQLWLSGLRQDARIMDGMHGYFASAASFLGSPEGKKATSKDTIKAVGGRDDVDRYLMAIYEWSMKPVEPLLAVRATEAAAKLKLTEPTLWIGERALRLVRLKPRKDMLVKLKDAFKIAGAFDKAVLCAEDAYRLDPSDGPLGAEIRELAASSTMSRGGYDQTGKEGGFRSNIRDQQKQRSLEEGDRVSKSDDVKDRQVEETKADLAKRPDDLPLLERYIKALVERGKPEDEAEAHDLLMKAFERTHQYRLRKAAGDLRIRQQQRKTSEAKRANVEAEGKDPLIAARFEQERVTLAQLEIEEYRSRIEAYPSDLTLKYELGKRYFALGQMEESIGCFQEAQNDPRTRVETLNLLGQAFLKSDFPDEAVETFRKALASSDILPDTAMNVNYQLMCALQQVADTRRDLTAAEEAEKIASRIMIQNIGYMDIKARREALKKLVMELRTK